MTRPRPSPLRLRAARLFAAAAIAMLLLAPSACKRASQPAPGQTVEGRATRDGEFQRVVAEQGNGALLRPPIRDGFQQPLGDLRRVKHAAVEQNGIRPGQAA